MEHTDNNSMNYTASNDNVWGIMKSLAILLVVLGHVTRMYTPQGLLNIGVYPSFLQYLTSFIYSFHMPAFFAVSGAVYYINKVEKGKYSNQANFIINKVKRLLVPYAFFAILWVFPTMWIMGYVNNPLNYFYESYVLGLNTRHLWFLIVLFEIFIFFNVCFVFLNKHRLLTLFLLIAVAYFKDYAPSYFQISNCCGYLLYFYLGFLMVPLFKKYMPSLRKKSLLLLIIVMSIWIVLNLAILKMSSVSVAKMPLTTLAAVFGTLLLYLLCNKVGGALYTSKIYRLLQNNSFGIYLFHPMIIYLFFFYTPFLWNSPYLLSITVLFTSLFISFILTNFLRKIKLSFALGE